MRPSGTDVANHVSWDGSNWSDPSFISRLEPISGGGQIEESIMVISEGNRLHLVLYVHPNDSPEAEEDSLWYVEGNTHSRRLELEPATNEDVPEVDGAIPNSSSETLAVAEEPQSNLELADRTPPKGPSFPLVVASVPTALLVILIVGLVTLRKRG